MPEDEVIFFECDVKHYFHLQCGKEWLQVKTECPLCRFDFNDRIKQFINKRKSKEADPIQADACAEASIAQSVTNQLLYSD